ncbi:MAG: DUF5125 domain-containing protein [Prevotellaceae bacterium]|jgi:hypothetical protein|nr:DUF5125 domain-containing protein [Prevotellaceae bacterium]
MKKYIYFLMTLIVLNSCSKDDDNQTLGNPVIEIKSELSNAMFGDNLPFTINVNDQVPLSTLKANLYFGEELVSTTTIRTKTNGDYTGTIHIPYYKNIPNGTATLDFILQNTNLEITKKTQNISLTRPDYPYLILVTRNGMYPMEKTGDYQYEATELFPNTDLPSYIKTPIISEWGSEIIFGWEDGSVTQGSMTDIPFVSSTAGRFSVTFNTLTYEATPFFEIFVNDQKMDMVDKSNFKTELELTAGQEVIISGIDDIASWWIDTDFFTKISDNKFTFKPISGKYRISANTTLKYFRIETMLGNDLAKLQPDGTGAIWVIGEGIGKPSLANEVQWEPANGLCMAPIGNKKYQITVVAGKTINDQSINFKFFHARMWDNGEFNATTLTTTGSIVFVGDGATPDYLGNNRDSGNMGLLQALEVDATYVFVVDVSAGIDNAVLTVTKQ